MIGYVDAPRAWGYTRGAARVLGVNLTAAVVDGWLSRPELARMIEVCHNCTHSDDCTAWLAKTVSAAALPEFCPNKATIEALKP